MAELRLSDSTPVYLKLRETLIDAMLDGTYGDGDLLPSVRAFAAQQGANPLTVAKAYQTFQDDGLIIVKRGVGMFVAEGANVRLHTMLREEFLTEIWPPIVQRMRRIGIAMTDISIDDDRTHPSPISG